MNFGLAAVPVARVPGLSRAGVVVVGVVWTLGSSRTVTVVVSMLVTVVVW